MNSKRIYILALFVLFNIGNTFAHALWIETTSTGKLNQKQQVSIYYGEYAENERDSVSHWFSDVKEVKLWLVSPDNKKVELTTTAEAIRLVADFTPTVNGTYTLLVDHPVKDVPRTTLYQFISSATIVVGNGNTSSSNQNINSLSLHATATYKVNKSSTVDAFFNNTKSTDITFSVVSPTGWTKTFKADANGNLTFTPIWPGDYYVEAFHTEKVKGEQNGKPYESVWRGATYIITVGK